MLKLNTSKGCFEDNILKIVAASRVIPILDIIDNFDYRRLVDNYYQYGFRTVEIRICSSHAKELVSYIQKNYPDIYIFAGTCLSVDDIDKARFMGLDILISPVFDNKLLEFCCLHNQQYIPCINSIETLNTAVSMGYSVLKFYPAEKCGGIEFLRQLQEKYDVRFMPSGGITIEKLPFYINEPNVAACCTSHISPFNLQEINDWQSIQNNIRTASQIINTYLEN